MTKVLTELNGVTIDLNSVTKTIEKITTIRKAAVRVY